MGSAGRPPSPSAAPADLAHGLEQRDLRRIAGIGARLCANGSSCGLPQVVKLLQGGPAALSGLVREGDFLVAARSQSDSSWTRLSDVSLDQVEAVLRGDEGSLVRLRVQRNDTVFDCALERSLPAPPAPARPAVKACAANTPAVKKPTAAEIHKRLEQGQARLNRALTATRIERLSDDEVRNLHEHQRAAATERQTEGIHTSEGDDGDSVDPRGVPLLVNVAAQGRVRYGVGRWIWNRVSSLLGKEDDGASAARDPERGGFGSGRDVGQRDGALLAVRAKQGSDGSATADEAGSTRGGSNAVAAQVETPGADDGDAGECEEEDEEISWLDRARQGRWLWLT